MVTMPQIFFFCFLSLIFLLTKHRVKQISENKREIQRLYHKVTFVLMQIVLDTGQPVLLCFNCWDVHHLCCEILEMQAGSRIYFLDFNRLPIIKSVTFRDLSPSFHCNHRFPGLRCHTWHIVRCSINAC